MAARRGRNQARRSGGGSNGLPGWAWLVIGVLATLLVIVLAPKFLDKAGEGGFFRSGGFFRNRVFDHGFFDNHWFGFDGFSFEPRFECEFRDGRN